MGQERVKDLLGNVKELAREYYTLTGRPLGVTAEIAEYEAALLLGLELAPVRQPGYDAIRETASGRTLLQIKGRRIPAGANSGQRVGRIDLEGEWDAVLLVLLDETFEATAIYEAGRPAITSAIQTPGSRARNRGQLGVGLFKALARWRGVDPDLCHLDSDLTASSARSQTDIYYRVVWQTTSAGDPSSVAPAACCASHTAVVNEEGRAQTGSSPRDAARAARHARRAVGVGLSQPLVDSTSRAYIRLSPGARTTAGFAQRTVLSTFSDVAQRPGRDARLELTAAPRRSPAACLRSGVRSERHLPAS